MRRHRGPQLVDLDGDGILDLISGSWPGEIFFFKGEGKGEYAKSVMLRDYDNKIINPEGGIEESGDGTILITGHATFEEDENGSYIDYHGERIVSDGEKSYAITGCASAVHIVDWDADDDLDMLVGVIGGEVLLYENKKGGPGEPIFAPKVTLRARNRGINVPGGDAGPYTADWDGDGDLDLLVGCGDGSVQLYPNVGTRKRPQLERAETLIPAGKVDYTNPASTPTRGTRAKICVTDWNRDGRLDLLVGDFALMKPPEIEQSESEMKAEQAAKARMEVLDVHWRAMIPRISGPSREKDTEKLEQLHKEFKTINDEMNALRGKIRQEREDHGWVWLFLQKAPAE